MVNELEIKSRYGKFGGCYAPEGLCAPLKEITLGFEQIKTDKKFQQEFLDLLKNYAGRPTALYHAKKLSQIAGAEIYLKREDLLHGGAHKTNNTLGQCLLAKYLGKTRIIAETGAGQHGVATAMTGALLGLPVEVYMGELDVKRQAQNVLRMKLFGAKVHAVKQGSATLKDAINEAMRDWITHAQDTYYCFGTAAGPSPFPELVAYFQEIIGNEARSQFLENYKQLPDAVVACVGGGSNAIGMFRAFLNDSEVNLFGAEAAGLGVDTDRHAATLTQGSEGVFHGMHSLFLQNNEGQIQEAHSISAGLDYPGIGPEHAYLQEINRVNYQAITDQEAMQAFELIAKQEGIIAAIESSHAVALGLKLAKDLPNKNSKILINLSGRGDKDLSTYESWKSAEKSS